MNRHYACITFDFDAMSGLVARGLTTPTPVSRGEFGAVALPRILDLLKRYDIKASFFIPGVVIGTYPRECEQILAYGHEIGHHGWTHVPPANLTPEQEEDGLIRGIEKIRELTGAAPRGYRSPSWDLSTYTVELLLRHGFLYESSMMGNDHEPYRVRQGDVVSVDEPMQFGKPTPLIELPISWTLDDFPHFEYLRVGQSLAPGLQNASGVLENWVNDFEYMRQTCDWGILTYTCHPYVIGRGHRMIMLDKLLKSLQEKGAQFITLEQAARMYDERSLFHA
ncbi:polysaccharide deacetylase family protein [Parapusillimonas granuli]|uniref:Polysaccharide deacetylase n=1 Tax=Parapusillimonas granuli TaxID=380911 RepID=A0A853FYK8_9BURK|nr:polysaccharide deacetylase [Parapusillimonas granuli]MBB5215630.1 peptidoglycan/xylan/chitin deacetylase (PgdA/CDA1 family) [Parapusillimonas granuli]NYT49703.1 polysaccharide deacetylase [Parapusillimonas granuli]